MCLNFLSLNTNKTKTIVFGAKERMLKGRAHLKLKS